jgi:hypothetical protein
MTTQPSHTERVESVSDVFAEKLGCQLHQVLGALDALIASEKRARIKSHNQRKELRLLSTAYRNMWDVVGERIDRERERANNADQRATKAERELVELRRRVEAGKEIMTPTKPDWADKEAARLWRWLSGWSQRDLAATLRSSYARGKREALEELYAALTATEPPQPPPARDPDMLGSAGIYQTTDPSYSGELTAGGSTGDGERACVDGASDAQHAPKRPTPAVATEADRIGGATAAPEPPAEPVACEQRVDAPGPPIVCECCQLSTDLYVTPQNLGTAPDELLAWVCRTCIKRLGIHIVAAVVRDRRSVSTITALRAELEQARADLTQAECARDDLLKAGWED